MTADIAFSRSLLKSVSSDVRSKLVRRALDRGVPDAQAARAHMKPMRDAWVWKAGRDHWEFHGPNGFYWHGRASNAYEARAHGWSAWLSNPNGRH